MTTEKALELVRAFAIAECDATKSGRSTMHERRTAKALLRALSPGHTFSVEEIESVLP